MNKYVSPEIEFEEIDSSDVILASGIYSVTALEGVDTGDDKSAVFKASNWVF